MTSNRVFTGHTTDSHQYNLRPRKMITYNGLSMAVNEIDEDKVSKNDGKNVQLYKKYQESHDNEIYEFKLDENEVEQNKKKKKKGVVRGQPAKKVNTPKNIEMDHITNKHHSPPEVAKEKQLEPKKNVKQTAASQSKNQNVNEDLIEAAPLNTDKTRVARKRRSYDNSDVYVEENSLARVNGGQKIRLESETVPKSHDKPKVISDQILRESSRINFTLRHANKKMIHHPLLNGSLSPIKNVNPSSESDSPWRPCLAKKTFSCIKNVFQSTPQSKVKASISIRQPYYKPNLKTKSLRSTEDSREKASTISTSESSRRFGTDISNINSFNSTSSIPSFLESPSKFGQLVKKFQSPIKNIHNSPQAFRVEISNKKSNENSKKIPTLNLDEIVEQDKENSSPNTEHQKKTPGSSPLNRLSKVARFLFYKLDSIDVENPQPGPSALESVDSNQESSRNTILNTFLNISDSPESTQINNSLLFCHVETVSVNTKKKKTTKRLSDKFDIHHMFGFDDDDDDDDDDFSQFEDPEPVHFNQPWRYSYKGELYDTINRSERKNGKFKKTKVDQQKKELENWAKNGFDDWAEQVNKKYEEIDKLELDLK